MRFKDFIVIGSTLECDEITCFASNDEVLVVHCHAIHLAAEQVLLTFVDGNVDAIHELESDLFFLVFAFHICELEIARAQLFREYAFGFQGWLRRSGCTLLG